MRHRARWRGGWPFALAPAEPVPLARLELSLPSLFHGLRKAIAHHAAARGVVLNVVIERDAMTQSKELVARGSGFTIFAPALAYDCVACGELVKSPIVDPVMARPVYLVRNPAHPQSNACRAVEAVVLDVTRDLVRRGICERRLATRA